MNKILNNFINCLINNVLFVHKYFFINNNINNLQQLLNGMKIKNSFLLFFLFLASSQANSIPTPSAENNISLYSNQEIVQLIYNNGEINIEGLTGIGNVYIYSIIGNPEGKFYNESLEVFKKPIQLKPRSLYIVQIETMGTIKTYKFVTKQF